MSLKTEFCLSDTLEDYIEAIYKLSKINKEVRITDIANQMGISKPSANRAVNSLKALGLVMHKPYGDILLTEDGKRIGNTMCIHHKLIKKFLVDVLHLDREDADREACQIKHKISQKTVDKMITFMEA